MGKWLRKHELERDPDNIDQQLHLLTGRWVGGVGKSKQFSDSGSEIAH